jgi:hypothetical protein
LTRIQRHRLRRLLDEGRELLSRERGREAADLFGRILLLDPDNSEARRGLEQARAAAVEAERVLAARLAEAESALAAGREEEARRLLDEVIRNGGDRDRARVLLDRLDRRPGRLHTGPGADSLEDGQAGGVASSPAWSRRAVITGWVVVFGLLATGVGSSWDRLLERLSRAPSPSSRPAPPASSLAAPSAGERAVADARRLLDQGETATALAVLDRIAPDEPAYPFARELKRQAEASMRSGGRGR